MKTKTIAAAALLVVTAALAVRGAENKAAAKLGPRQFPDGYRAFAFSVPEAQLTFLQKDDRVDALTTFEALIGDKGSERKERVTATILQNCVVLDIRRGAKPGDPGAVELLLNPNESQYLALALEQGSVHLIRRTSGDKEMKPMEMASFRKLFR